MTLFEKYNTTEFAIKIFEQKVAYYIKKVYGKTLLKIGEKLNSSSTETCNRYPIFIAEEENENIIWEKHPELKPDFNNIIEIDLYQTKILYT